MTEAVIRRLIYFVLWIVAMGSPLLLAQDIRVVGSLPYGAVFAVNGWTPIKIDVRNDSDRAFSGTARAIPMDEGSAEYRAALDLAPQSRASTILWARFASAGKQNSIARVTYNDAGGAVLARSEMAGAPAGAQSIHYGNGVAECGYLLAIMGDEALPTDEQDLDGLGQTLATSFELRGIGVALGPETAPSSAVSYAGAYLVHLRGMDPDLLAPVQRQAILDYVRAGGALLLCAPDARVLNSSWVAPLLPVKLLGNREMNQVPSPSGGEPMVFGAYFACSEAQRGDGTVLLADGSYVYAAYRNLGLGRVIYTSFPASSLKPQDDRAARLWKELLGITRPPIGTAGSSLSTQYPQLMEPMLGRQAASWTVAITAAGGLAILVLAAHLIWRGASRPRAFQVSLGASVVLAAAFWTFAALRQESEPLQEARLTVVDASDQGSLINEYAAVSGPQQTIQRQVVDPDAPIYPSLSRQDRPLLSEWPATVDRIDVKPQQVNLVTLATRLDAPRKAIAKGQFTADGLMLTVTNDLGTPLTSAQLSWEPYRMSLPAIAPGETKSTAGNAQVRPADEFTSASGLTSQAEQQRGDILKASLESAPGAGRQRLPWPTVIGWAADWPASSRLSLEPDHANSHSQTLVRIPLQIEPSPAGKVRIDAVFNRIVMGESRGLPYDTAISQFIQSSLTGAWVLGIQAPGQIGAIRPEKARVTIDLQTPQHTFTLRKGQCRDGKAIMPRGNGSGEVVGNWSAEVGVRTVQFVCAPADFDSQGRLWLQLDVQRYGAVGSMGIEPAWRIGRFQVDIEGQVTPSSETK